MRCRRTGHEAAAVHIQDHSVERAGRNEPLSMYVALVAPLRRQSEGGELAVQPRRAEDATRACRERIFIPPVLTSNQPANRSADDSRLPTRHTACLLLGQRQP